MNGRVTAEDQAFLALCRENTGGKYRVAVVDENLNGAAVDEKAKVEQSLRQRTGTLFAQRRIKAAFHARAVYRYFLCSVVVCYGNAAVAVFVRKKTQRHISAPANQLKLANARKDIGGFRIELSAPERAE